MNHSEAQNKAIHAGAKNGSSHEKAMKKPSLSGPGFKKTAKEYPLSAGRIGDKYKGGRVVEIDMRRGTARVEK